MSRSVRTWLAVAAFLALLPVTLPVPVLPEVVIGGRGGTRLAAHLFMAVNMLSGIAAVPIVLRLVGAGHRLARWTAALLAGDAAAFALMALSHSTGTLLAARALDGACHLPAVALLTVWANRAAGERHGAALGLIASAMMAGIAAGAPIGGWLLALGPDAVFWVAAVLLALAALACARVPSPPARGEHESPRSYRWNRRAREAWAPLALGFMERFMIGVFVSTFTLFLTEVHHVTPAARGVLMALFLLPFAALCLPAGVVTDRLGWYRPAIVAHLAFGALYATYGVLPVSALAGVMVLSGVLSAFMYAPTLVAVGALARRGAGDGLFGALQVAGSLGFLAGPIVGGTLVEVARTGGGAPAYPGIFTAVGILEVSVAAIAAVVLRRAGEADPARIAPALLPARMGGSGAL